MRSVRWALTAGDRCPYKKRTPREDRQTHGEQASAAEAQTEAMWLELRNVKGHWQLPGVGKRPGRILPESQRGHDSADTPTPDF